jgi:hypothetical protein
MYLRSCGSYKSESHKKIYVLKSKNRKEQDLLKVRKSYKLFKSANVRLCDSRNFFADRPPLLFSTHNIFFLSSKFQACIVTFYSYLNVVCGNLYILALGGCLKKCCYKAARLLMMKMFIILNSSRYQSLDRTFSLA